MYSCIRIYTSSRFGPVDQAADVLVSEEGRIAADWGRRFDLLVTLAVLQSVARRCKMTLSDTPGFSLEMRRLFIRVTQW